MRVFREDKTMRRDIAPRVQLTGARGENGKALSLVSAKSLERGPWLAPNEFGECPVAGAINAALHR